MSPTHSTRGKTTCSRSFHDILGSAQFGIASWCESAGIGPWTATHLNRRQLFQTLRRTAGSSSADHRRLCSLSRTPRDRGFGTRAVLNGGEEVQDLLVRHRDQPRQAASDESAGRCGPGRGHDILYVTAQTTTPLRALRVQRQHAQVNPAATALTKKTSARHGSRWVPTWWRIPPLLMESLPVPGRGVEADRATGRAPAACGAATTSMADPLAGFEALLAPPGHGAARR